jgi:hypothetical protein
VLISRYPGPEGNLGRVSIESSFDLELVGYIPSGPFYWSKNSPTGPWCWFHRQLGRCQVLPSCWSKKSPTYPWCWFRRRSAHDRLRECGRGGSHVPGVLLVHIRRTASRKTTSVLSEGAMAMDAAPASKIANGIAAFMLRVDFRSMGPCRYGTGACLYTFSIPDQAIGKQRHNAKFSLLNGDPEEWGQVCFGDKSTMVNCA